MYNCSPFKTQYSVECKDFEVCHCCPFKTQYVVECKDFEVCNCSLSRHSSTRSARKRLKGINGGLKVKVLYPSNYSHFKIH